MAARAVDLKKVRRVDLELIKWVGLVELFTNTEEVLFNQILLVHYKI